MAKYSNLIIEAAKRVHKIFDEGCDRCDFADLEMLEAAGLMDRTICRDTFGQDTLELGEPMWTFNARGKTLLAKSRRAKLVEK